MTGTALPPPASLPICLSGDRCHATMKPGSVREAGWIGLIGGLLMPHRDIPLHGLFWLEPGL